jgi:hypothetical protein
MEIVRSAPRIPLEPTMLSPMQRAAFAFAPTLVALVVLFVV